MVELGILGQQMESLGRRNEEHSGQGGCVFSAVKCY